MRTRIEKERDFFMSKCCKAPYESIFKEGGKVILRCTECGKDVGVLEEKFKKGSWPDFYD